MLPPCLITRQNNPHAYFRTTTRQRAPCPPQASRDPRGRDGLLLALPTPRLDRPWRTKSDLRCWTELDLLPLPTIPAPIPRLLLIISPTQIHRTSPKTAAGPSRRFGWKIPKLSFTLHPVMSLRPPLITQANMVLRSTRPQPRTLLRFNSQILKTSLSMAGLFGSLLCPQRCRAQMHTKEEP